MKNNGHKSQKKIIICIQKYINPAYSFCGPFLALHCNLVLNPEGRHHFSHADSVRSIHLLKKWSVFLYSPSTWARPSFSLTSRALFTRHSEHTNLWPSCWDLWSFPKCAVKTLPHRVITSIILITKISILVLANNKSQDQFESLVVLMETWALWLILVLPPFL